MKMPVVKRVDRSCNSLCLLAASLLLAHNACAQPQLGSFYSEGSVIHTGTYEDNPDVANGKQITGLGQSKTVINWDSFNIANGETVSFKLNNATDSVLNLINDSAVSTIDGTLLSNGEIILINNSGIIFGQDANVSVGSLVASSLSIDAAEYITSQSYSLQANADNKGVIINNANITAATGGNVALLGNSVINRGSISARLGKISLVAGEAMTMSFDNDGLMQFQVDSSVKSNPDNLESAVLNDESGVLYATQIILEASVAADVFTHAVNHTGSIRASGFRTDASGDVWLIAEGGSIAEGEGATTLADQVFREEKPELIDPEPEPEPETNEPTTPTSGTPNDTPETPAEPEPVEPVADEPVIDDPVVDDPVVDDPVVDDPVVDDPVVDDPVIVDGPVVDDGPIVDDNPIIEDDPIVVVIDDVEEEPDFGEADGSVINANSLDPTPGNDNSGVANTSLGLFNVEAPGIKLPDDQREEAL